jgi:ribonuclease HI
MVSSKHIKMEEGEKNPTKENPTIFKKRLMRENKNLKEIHEIELKWLKEKHQKEINDLLQKLKDKEITIEIMHKQLYPTTLN